MATDFADRKHVVINRENMTFVGATASCEGASMLANLAPMDASMVIFSLDLKSSFSQFGRLELMLLIKNHTGEELPAGAIHDYPWLINKSFELAQQIPMDARSLFDLQQEHAKRFPSPPPSVGTWKPAPTISRLDPAAVANYVPSAPEPKVPRAPKAPAAPGSAPSKGSTGKVWEIADRVLAETGLTIGSKQLRTAIIDACKLAGINEGTAATQYGKWKATK